MGWTGGGASQPRCSDGPTVAGQRCVSGRLLQTPRTSAVIDTDVSQLRVRVDEELATLLASTGPVLFRPDEISGMRQFLGWHRLRYREDLPLDDLPPRLAQFIVDRSAARGPRDEGGPGALEQAMVAADLLRQEGSFTMGTLRRRIAALAHVYRAGNPAALRRHPAVQDALRAADHAERRSKPRRSLDGCPLPDDERARLLATCDGSSIGLRDRALLSAWYATGASLATLTRLDERALLDAISRCPRAGDRAAAALAVKQWCGHAKLPAGPVFRRVWASDRIGAPMNGDAANRMLRRRLALSASSANDS